MKIEEIDYGKSKKISPFDGFAVHCTTATSNCKITYMDFISSLQYNIKGDDTTEFKKAMDMVLPLCRITVFVHTNSKNIANAIKAHYECYYWEEIPIGYNIAGPQWHILIKNTLSKPGGSWDHYAADYLREKKTPNIGETPTKQDNPEGQKPVETTKEKPFVYLTQEDVEILHEMALKAKKPSPAYRKGYLDGYNHTKSRLKGL